jgi:hypothetical protein
MTGKTMRLSVFLLAFAALFSTAARGEDDCPCWTPSAADIAAVEAKIAGRSLPLGSLDRYARYYTGEIEPGIRMIVGQPYSVGRIRGILGKLVPAGGNESSGIHILEGSMPPLQGEGCITYSDPDGGSWLRLQCARSETWTPSAAEIAAMEAKMDEHRLPLGSLDRYARYYAAIPKNWTIVGKLVPTGGSDLPGVHVIDQGRLPILAAEGCVTRFNGNIERSTSLSCARPGAWTPSDAQVTELEDLLRDHGGPKLEQHARHYSGVIEDGHKIIRGHFLWTKGRNIHEPAGMHIHSEVESPLMVDGGCAFVRVTYDPSTKATTWQCNSLHGTNVIDQGAYDPASGKTIHKCEKVPKPPPPTYWRGPSGYVAVPPPGYWPFSDCCRLPDSFQSPESGVVQTARPWLRPAEVEDPAHPLSICKAP